MRVTSTHNPAVRYVRSLERASQRREDGVYLAEGIRLVADALGTGQHATLVLFSPDSLSRTAKGSLLLERVAGWADQSHEVDERVLRAAAQTEHPSGVVAVLRLPESPPLQTHGDDRFGIVLDHLADPGNAGTILRTAAAAGVSYVVALAGTVDPFAPKVVRAGMGAHFRLPIYSGVDADELVSALPGVANVATVAEGGESIYCFDWPAKTALVVGSEATGISERMGRYIQARVTIPMMPGVESLNAAVAAAIVVYTALGPGISLEE